VRPRLALPRPPELDSGRDRCRIELGRARRGQARPHEGSGACTSAPHTQNARIWGNLGELFPMWPPFWHLLGTPFWGHFGLRSGLDPHPPGLPGSGGGPKMLFLDRTYPKVPIPHPFGSQAAPPGGLGPDSPVHLGVHSGGGYSNWRALIYIYIYNYIYPSVTEVDVPRNGVS